MRQYFTNKAAAVVAYFNSYAEGAEQTNKLLAFSSLCAQYDKLSAKLKALKNNSSLKTSADRQATNLKSTPKTTWEEKTAYKVLESKYYVDLVKLNATYYLPMCKFKAEQDNINKAIDVLKLTDEQINMASGTWGAYAKAQAYVLPYNVAVCIKSIPSAISAKATASYEWAKSHRTQVAYGLGFCALAFAGGVAGYKNQAAITQVCSDVLSKMLKSCSKHASHALKVVAEQATTYSAKLAK